MDKFREIIANKFEKEFMPSQGNSWLPILDDNLEGSKRYYGLLEQECLPKLD